MRRTCSVIARAVGSPLWPTVTRIAPSATDSVMLTCSTRPAIASNRAAFSVALRSQSSTSLPASDNESTMVVLPLLRAGLRPKSLCGHTLRPGTDREGRHGGNDPIVSGASPSGTLPGSGIGHDGAMSDVDEYFTGLRPDSRDAFDRVRRLAMSVAPEATGGTRSGMGGPRHRRQPLLGFREGKGPLSVFPFSPAAVDAVRARLAGFGLGKGTIRVTAGQPPDAGR